MRKLKILSLLSLCFLGIASCSVKPIPSDDVKPNNQDYVEVVDYFQIVFKNGNGSNLYNKNLPKGYDLTKIANTLFPTLESDGDHDYHFEKWEPNPTVVEDNTVFRPRFISSPRETFTYEANASQTEYSIVSYNLESATEIEIPDKYKDLPVVGIKANAFRQKSKLVKVTLGNNIKTIEENAFYGCSSLTSVIYKSDTAALETIKASAFSECRKLKNFYLDPGDTEIPVEAPSKLTFPTKLKTLGASAFEGCAALTAIEIPKSVTSIGTKLVKGCTLLTSIVINSENTTYASLSSNLILKKSGGVVIAGCKTSLLNNASIVEIADNVFDGISFVTINLNDPTNFITTKVLSLPANIKKIGKYAFSNNTSLETVTMAGAISMIDQTSFEGCTNLRQLSITGESNDFQTQNNCLIRKANSANVTLPEGLSMPYIMHGTMGMTSIPANVRGIGPRAFYRSQIEAINLSSSAENNKISYIGDEAFRECTRLTAAELYLPSMVRDAQFPANLFRGCTSLINFTISSNFVTMKIADDNNLTKGNGSFYDCTSLTKVYINSNLGNIPENTFTNCTAIRHVYFSGTESEWKSRIRPSSGTAQFKRLGNNTIFGADDNQFSNPNVTVHFEESGNF